MGSPHIEHPQALAILREHGPLAAEECASPLRPRRVAASLLAHLIDHGYAACLDAGPGTPFAVTARGREEAPPPAAAASPAVLIPALLFISTFLMLIG
jgi:hypothetical protein